MNRGANPNPSDVELQELGRGRDFDDVPLDHPNPLAIGAEVFRDKEGQRRRSWRTILGLMVLVGSLLIATTTFSVLYVTQTTKPLELQTTTTTTTTASTTLVLTSLTTTTLVSTRKRPTAETVTSFVVTTETTTASRTKFLTSLVTATLVSTQPTTVTSTSITTAQTARRKAETTSVTTIVTTTLYLATTQASSIAVSPGSPPPSGGKCIPRGSYGGEELHVLNADYDLSIVSAVETSAGAGLDIGSGDPLTVGLGSIFRCATEDHLELVAACRQGYLRTFDGIACSGPAYATSATFTLPRVIPAPATTVPSTTETTTDEVLVTITENRFLGLGANRE